MGRITEMQVGVAIVTGPPTHSVGGPD